MRRQTVLALALLLIAIAIAGTLGIARMLQLTG